MKTPGSSEVSVTVLLLLFHSLSLCFLPLHQQLKNNGNVTPGFLLKFRYWNWELCHSFGFQKQKYKLNIWSEVLFKENRFYRINSYESLTDYIIRLNALELWPVYHLNGDDFNDLNTAGSFYLCTARPNSRLRIASQANRHKHSGGIWQETTGSMAVYVRSE